MPKTCHKCGTPEAYSEKYDACFCPKEKIWLESKCSDPTCEFCSNRPEKPN